MLSRASPSSPFQCAGSAAKDGDVVVAVADVLRCLDRSPMVRGSLARVGRFGSRIPSGKYRRGLPSKQSKTVKWHLAVWRSPRPGAPAEHLLEEDAGLDRPEEDDEFQAGMSTPVSAGPP